MTPIGAVIEQVLAELQAKTGTKWSAQLTSKGFIVYRKPRNDEHVVHEYNKWRDACTAIFNIGYEVLDDDMRDWENVKARHWCWYMMAAVSMINVDTIVKLINGQKDRTSILHAIRKIHNYIYRKSPDRKSVDIYGDLLEYYLTLK